jgi:hypothetical protein
MCSALASSQVRPPLFIRLGHAMFGSCSFESRIDEIRGKIPSGLAFV